LISVDGGDTRYELIGGFPAKLFPEAIREFVGPLRAIRSGKLLAQWWQHSILYSALERQTKAAAAPRIFIRGFK